MLIGRDVAGPGGPRRVVDRLEPGRNVFEADEQYHRFSIDPKDQLKAERAAEKEGRAVLGYYHSHPDHPARPSETDRRIAAEGLSDGVVHMVVGVEGGKRALPSAWVFRDRNTAFEEEPLEIE
jgi:proteasome lid subunit RPN8/RPN11